MGVDLWWYLEVNEFARQTPWLHGVVAAYALWGGLVVLAGMLIAGYLVGRTRDRSVAVVSAVVCAGVGTVVALLVNQDLVSPAVGRARPCQILAHVEVLLSCAHDYSFPSDHCVLAGAFAAGLAFLGVRWAVPAAAVALLLAFSRVYTGVHYPSDAAAGLVMGAVIGVVVVVVLRPAVGRLAGRMAGTRLYPLVASRPREAPRRAPMAH
ncbi:MAG: phosphatase PAP2 family protein [Pseudonocardiaceae bacterium]